MARFKAGQENNYGGTGGTGFFSIANDMETKQVRFLYNSIDDMEGMSVHKVEVNGKERYVNCIREYDEPVDACPFCKRNIPLQARLFIPVYNIDEDQVQIWDRGKTMFSKMSGLFSRYSGNGRNFVSNVFEVERHGAPKSTKTTYEIFQVDKDDTQLKDLPEPRKVLGGLVLDESAEDMEYYLQHKEFPAKGEDTGRRENSETVRRRDVARRRTPAGGNSDEF